MVESCRKPEFEFKCFPPRGWPWKARPTRRWPLDELKQANPDHQTEIIEVQLSVLLHGERFDDAAIVLDKIAGQETNAVKLNQISWMIYEAAADNQISPTSC